MSRERSLCSYHWILEQRITHRQHKQENHQQTWLFESHTGDQREDCLFQGKDDWQKFWETTFTIDQKEREPGWQEAILLLMRFVSPSIQHPCVENNERSTGRISWRNQLWWMNDKQSKIRR